jgi:hypothetical protein
MKRLAIALATTLAALPLVASADNVGSCGWGSKLFTGQKGLFPQVLAVTTNGTFGNQTFGITSGTSGCTRDGVVTSSWASNAFIDANMNRLALDMSRGKGESLQSLGSLMQVTPVDQAAFTSTLKGNFNQIFPTPATSSAEAIAALRNVIQSDARLAKYSANV